MSPRMLRISSVLVQAKQGSWHGQRWVHYDPTSNQLAASPGEEPLCPFKMNMVNNQLEAHKNHHHETHSNGHIADAHNADMSPNLAGGFWSELYLRFSENTILSRQLHMPYCRTNESTASTPTHTRQRHTIQAIKIVEPKRHELNTTQPSLPNLPQ